MPCRPSGFAIKEMVSQAVVLGLLSALLYGATDFVARLSGQAIGPLRTILYGHTAAAIALFAAMLAGAAEFPRPDARVWFYLAASNALLLAATACLYRALVKGRVTVVVPIVASYGGVSAVLAGLAGEPISGPMWIGLAAVFLGCILAARPQPSAAAEKNSDGIAPAIAAAILYGGGFWLQGAKVVAAMGFLFTTFTYYVLGSIVSAALAMALRKPVKMAARQVPLALGTTALACGGTLALTAGQATGEVALVTTLSALASAVTVAWPGFSCTRRCGRRRMRAWLW